MDKWIGNTVERIKNILFALSPIRSSVGGTKWNAFQQLLAEKGKKKDFFFIQIGAHGGGVKENNKGKYSPHILDPIHRFVKKYRWKGILIEPQPDMFIQLKQYYKHYLKNLIFENLAISKTDGRQKLFICEDSLHSSLVNDRGDKSRKVKKIKWVEGITFDNLLHKHSVNKIDLLQIDVEGYDYEIIKTINFDHVKPKIINFEHRHIPDQDKEKCINTLKQNGYHLYFQDEFDTTMILKKKYLYASPVGRKGKDFLMTIIDKFGTKDFDYLIFAYDETPFDEPIFKDCRFIREKGYHTYFFKKYLTPQYCMPYDYIFPWMDDIDIENFSVTNFIEIMKRNDLELAQPALSEKSMTSHDITKKHNYRIGRFTKFVELMVQVFRSDAWLKYWAILDKNAKSNPYGWGYDFVCKKVCGLKNLGIIDAECVTHTRRFTATGKGREHDFPLSQKAIYRLLRKYNVPHAVKNPQQYYLELK